MQLRFVFLSGFPDPVEAPSVNNLVNLHCRRKKDPFESNSILAARPERNLEELKLFTRQFDARGPEGMKCRLKSESVN